jgi:hypothetical protein
MKAERKKLGRAAMYIRNNSFYYSNSTSTGVGRLAFGLLAPGAASAVNAAFVQSSPAGDGSAIRQVSGVTDFIAGYRS